MIDIRIETRRVKRQIHVARKAGTPATLLLEEWIAIIKHFNGKCAYCQQRKFELMEHIVAVKAGGGTTALNCVPACISCNRRKDSSLLLDPLPEYKIAWVRAEVNKITAQPVSPLQGWRHLTVL